MTIQKKFLWSSFLSFLGTNLITNISIYILVANDYSDTYIWILKNIYIIPLLIIPLLGKRVETMNSTKVIVLSDLFSFVASLFFLLFTLYFTNSRLLIAIAIYLFIVSIFNALKLSYEIKFFNQLDKELNSDLMSKYFSTQMFAKLIAPTFSLLLFNYFTYSLQISILIDGVSFIGLFVAIKKLNELVANKSSIENSDCSEQNFPSKKGDIKFLSLITLTMFLTMLLFNGFLFTTYQFDFSLAQISINLSSAVIGGIFGNIIFERFNHRKKTLILLTLCAMIYSLVFLGYISENISILSFFFVGMCNSIVNLIFILKRQKFIPEDLNVRANIIIKNLIIITVFLSEFLYLISNRVLFVIILVFLLISIIISVKYYKMKVRKNE